MHLSRFLIASATLAGLFVQSAAQNRTWIYDPPADEAAALASIVEDDPNDIPAARKGDESPLYPLIYGRPLPIPPVKEPLK